MELQKLIKDANYIFNKNIQVKKKLIYRIEELHNTIYLGIQYFILKDVLNKYIGLLTYKNKQELENIIKVLKENRFEEE